MFENISLLWEKKWIFRFLNLKKKSFQIDMFKTLQSYENMKNTNKKFKYFDWKFHTIKKQNIGKSTLACLFLSASHNCVHTFQRGIINLIKIRAVLSIRSPRHNFRKLFKSSDLLPLFSPCDFIAINSSAFRLPLCFAGEGLFRVVCANEKHRHPTNNPGTTKHGLATHVLPTREKRT